MFEEEQSWTLYLFFLGAMQVRAKPSTTRLMTTGTCFQGLLSTLNEVKQHGYLKVTYAQSAIVSICSRL